VEIDYTVSGNTTMPGQSNPDHDLDNGTIIFAAGEVSKNISITLIDDTIFEPSESLILTLSNPVASTIAVGAGVHTMTVNDKTEINTGSTIKDLTNGNSTTYVTAARVQEVVGKYGMNRDLAM
jgi:hypothetical protein